MVTVLYSLYTKIRQILGQKLILFLIIIFHNRLPNASPSPKTAVVGWYQSASALIWHSHIWSDFSNNLFTYEKQSIYFEHLSFLNLSGMSVIVLLFPF